MLDWIMNIIGGDYNQKQIDALMPLVRDINHRYAEFDALSDADSELDTDCESEKPKNLNKELKTEPLWTIYFQKRLPL